MAGCFIMVQIILHWNERSLIVNCQKSGQFITKLQDKQIQEHNLAIINYYNPGNRLTLDAMNTVGPQIQDKEI